MGVTGNAQITQSSKFAISLQCFKKEASEEVDFLYVDKHESFRQINSGIFERNAQAFPKFPK